MCSSESIIELKENLLRIPPETEDYVFARQIISRLDKFINSSNHKNFKKIEKEIVAILARDCEPRLAVSLVIEDWLEEMRFYHRVVRV